MFRKSLEQKRGRRASKGNAGGGRARREAPMPAVTFYGDMGAPGHASRGGTGGPEAMDLGVACGTEAASSRLSAPA